MHEVAATLAQLADEMDMDPATLAVAWAAHHPAVTTPIISARNVQQLEPSLEASNITLNADASVRMEALSPRPAPATDRLEEASS